MAQNPSSGHFDPNAIFTGQRLKDLRVFEVPRQHLRPNPFNPRKSFDEERLNELRDSIQRDGQLAPLHVVEDLENTPGYIIVAGERRYRACGMLPEDHPHYSSMYAILLTDLNERDLRRIALIENLQREDLKPIEEAEALQSLLNSHGYNQTELSKELGKSRQSINEILLLNTLPDAIKEYCRTSGNSFAKSTLIQVARIEDSKEQLLLWDQVKTGGVTVREARKKKAKAPIATHEPRPLDQRAISVGNSFIRVLEALTDTEFQRENNDTFRDLVAIRAKIDDILNGVPQRITDTGDETKIEY